MTSASRRILVIEDAADVLTVLILLLRADGATVTGAACGREALTAFHADLFDVVVTDLGLPDMSGDVLIRAMIAAARRPIEIVVITGESEPARSRALLQAGATAVFTKPCRWDSVITHLDRLRLAPAA